MILYDKMNIIGSEWWFQWVAIINVWIVISGQVFKIKKLLYLIFFLVHVDICVSVPATPSISITVWLKQKGMKQNAIAPWYGGGDEASCFRRVVDWVIDILDWIPYVALYVGTGGRTQSIKIYLIR